jgi:hypothetical protein
MMRPAGTSKPWRLIRRRGMMMGHAGMGLVLSRRAMPGWREPARVRRSSRRWTGREGEAELDHAAAHAAMLKRGQPEGPRLLAWLVSPARKLPRRLALQQPAALGSP